MLAVGSKKSIFKKWEHGSVLVTDAGWGDNGKGKTISYLDAQFGARCVGGHNAGHTVVTDKGEFGLGLTPCTILNPGCFNVIGQDVVIDPVFLKNEIENLVKFGVTVTSKNLAIDENSHLVMPWHGIRDALSEESKGKTAVGSLHLGIGWSFIDRMDRKGLKISDLMAKDTHLRIKNELNRQMGLIEEMKLRVHLMTGSKSKVDDNMSATKITRAYLAAADFLSKYVNNTRKIIYDAISAKKRILFEDAHGTMLDISHGTWPYTTGAHVGLGGVYDSFGGKAVRSIKKIVVSMKAYQTRVGGGPIPTEDLDVFGKIVFERGHEFGTRSGRARRCGPIDIPLNRFGLDVIGAFPEDEIALTKLDVLDTLDEIPVCVAYKIGSKTYTHIPNGSAEFVQKVKPVYVVLRGWKKDTTNIRKFSDLPKEARDYVLFLRKHLNQPITMIGVGKHKDAVILP
ncbi:hypothetical protein A2627_04995 [Candidatus Woesebacteria bacterium RIFCSPHIGHO2_01_FULL_39_28]|uniref:Adenylosuccinate synthetase n=1 Tax=Candidatus Woesebacteria bacterium RIFCSPHIGHO2_01_FULL_39_28 TaxID=1802496 RepID=A0A1F7YCD2_9BACT|nr:MAG: hypothetical protein A2627_04995 [Candidatus Woesebacteria bacterium RIFCSPHIGHO2_01_FULL_39_28]